MRRAVREDGYCMPESVPCSPGFHRSLKEAECSCQVVSLLRDNIKNVIFGKVIDDMGFRRICGKIIASSGGVFTFLTESFGKHKIRNCELEESKELATVTARRPEAVFINKGVVKRTCLRLVRIERSLL